MRERIAPWNKRVVWESRPACRDNEGYTVFGEQDAFGVRLPSEVVVRASEVPLGSRIRITAEVLLPETEVQRG